MNFLPIIALHTSSYRRLADERYSSRLFIELSCVYGLHIPEILENHAKY